MNRKTIATITGLISIGTVSISIVFSNTHNKATKETIQKPSVNQERIANNQEYITEETKKTYVEKRQNYLPETKQTIGNINQPKGNSAGIINGNPIFKNNENRGNQTNIEKQDITKCTEVNNGSACKNIGNINNH